MSGSRRSFIGTIGMTGFAAVMSANPVTARAVVVPSSLDSALPTLDEFEGDWILSQTSGTDNVTSSLFLGPAGARVLVSLLPMNSADYYPFEPIKAQVIDLSKIISGAGYDALDSTSVGLDQRRPLPKSITYAYRYEAQDLIWGEPYAIGAYAAGNELAALIAITGTVNALVGAEAMDAVALKVLGVSPA